MREFLHVYDLSDACLFLLKNYNEPVIVNIGVGKDITIEELEKLISQIVDFKGKIEFDFTKANGRHRKLLDATKINKFGWFANITLKEGLEKTISEYD